jgi:hypothetical protein
MAAMTYLHKHPKTGVYYFRRAIPPDLRPFIGKGVQWKETLSTKNVAEAKRHAHDVASRVEAAFDEARRKANPDLRPALSDAEIAALAREWLSVGLYEDAKARLAADAPYSEADVEEQLAGFDELEGHLRGFLRRNNYSDFNPMIDAALQERGRKLNPTSPSYRAIGQVFARAGLEAIKQLRAQLKLPRCPPQRVPVENR